MLAINNAALFNRAEQTATVLLIEDNEGDAGLVRAILNPKHFHVEWCDTATKARRALARQFFDVVLLDHGLPDTNALSFLSEIKTNEYPSPVIILTGHDDETLAISALKSGAQNYILKDEIFDYLQPAVEEVIQEQAEISNQPTDVQTAEFRFVDRAQQHYKTLLETMNEGCCVISADGMVLFANEALASFTRQDPAQFLGQPAEQLFPKTAAFSINDILVKAKSNRLNEAKRIESCLQDADGIEIPVLLSIRAMQDKFGNFTDLLLVITDVAELVWARKKLDTLYRYEHQQNRKLQALSQIATAVSNLDTNDFLASTCQIISEVFQFDAVVFAEVGSNHIYIQPEHYLLQEENQGDQKQRISFSRKHQCPINTAANQQRVVNIANVANSAYAKPNGNNAYAECALPIVVNRETIAVLDVINQTVNSLSKDDLLILSVICERLAKAFENSHLFDSVARERKRLAALIESSHEGVLFFSSKLTISVINSKAISWLGLSGKVRNWINQPVQKLIKALRYEAPELSQTFLQEIRRALMGEKQASSGEFSRSPFMLSWYSTPISAKSSTGWLFVLRDKSKEHAVEQLRQDLTHTMVHDLRNPLAIILGMLDLLKNSSYLGQPKLEGRQKECLDYASSSAQKLMKLVNNILDVSKLESDQIPLNKTAVSIQKLLSQCVEEQQGLLTAKSLSIQVTVSDDLPPIQMDADLIGRVLQNLLDNAIKFTPSDGKVSLFAFLINNQNKPTLAVSVADTGEGIPPEAQERLFEKFFTLNQAGKGSGLGLAFCRLVIEEHGGKIWVNSLPGKGSRFIFTLPLE